MMEPSEEVWKQLYHYLYYRTGHSHPDAEDLLQQVRVAAWRSEVEPADPWSWLVGVARNCLSHWYRDRAAGVRVQQAGKAGVDLAVAQSEAAVAAEETGLCLHLTLSALPPEVAGLLLDKYQGGMSLEALARRRGQSEDAVKSALARAREAFKRQWRKTINEGEEERA